VHSSDLRGKTAIASHCRTLIRKGPGGTCQLCDATQLSRDENGSDTADIDTNSFSFSDRILGSNTDTDNILCVK
jgi:hypothetical protein